MLNAPKNILFQALRESYDENGQYYVHLIVSRHNNMYYLPWVSTKVGNTFNTFSIKFSNRFVPL